MSAAKSSDKPILFFSEYCNFCKSIINDIIKKNIRNRFLLLNIDNKAHSSLPKFVDRVPLVFIADENRVLIEDDIESLVASIAAVSNTSKEVEPFLMNEMGSGMSDVYSYIDNEDVGSGEKNFAFVDKEIRINTPADNDNSGTGGRGGDSSLGGPGASGAGMSARSESNSNNLIEQLIAQRNMDIQQPTQRQ